MTPRLKKTIAGALAVAAVALSWYYLAPPQVGGRTSWVMVDGTSMLPHFHTGDLVLVRGGGDYRVGEVVAYRNQQLGGRIVMHRIIGVADGRYTFKGDNNSFVDPTHPVQADLVGHEWVRLPGAGRILSWLRGPRNAAIVAGLAALLLVGTGSRARRRGRRDAAGERARATSRGLPSLSGLHSALPPVGGVAIVFLLLAALAFTRPTTQSVSWPDAYQQKGSFGYSGAAVTSPVYRDGRIHSGQPVFTKLASGVDVHFDYTFASKAAHAVAGSASLAAVLTDQSGWHRTVVLQKPTAFTGDTASVGGRLDLATLVALTKRYQALTGLQATNFQLSLVPDVKVHGVLAGRPLSDSYAPRLQFQLDPLELQLSTLAAPGSQENTNTLTRSTQGEAERVVPATLSLPKLRLSVATARRVALAGSGLSLLALALLGLPLARGLRRGDEVSRIRARYGHLIVEVEGQGLGARTVTDVEEVDDLARLAEYYERMILHVQEQGVDSYLVDDGATVYRYRIGERAAPRFAPQPPDGIPTAISWPTVDRRSERSVGARLRGNGDGRAAHEQTRAAAR